MGIGGYFPEVKWSGCEDDHSAPPSTEVKNECSYTSGHPLIPSWH
jgi:hypothetical protein